MIQMLQRRFIVTAMTAISVLLLLLLLGTINGLNLYYVDAQSKERLDMISQNEGDPHNLPTPPEAAPPRAPREKNDYDTLMASNFFVVRFDPDRQVVATDVSRVSFVSEEEAAALAEEVYARAEQSGKVDGFAYMLRQSRMGGGKVAVFLDTSGDLASCLRVLLLSAAIGAACWLAMLLFVILLSKRAICPIAENMQRQKQFVTNAGHEIKTPIAIIQSNTEAMELYHGENKWSKNIKEQTARLSELMKHLLTLARMDESGGQLVLTDCSLSQLLAEQTASFEEAMALREITLESRIQPRVCLRANREHLTQLLSVLMDNAVKYTDDNGKIVVRLEKKEKRIKLQMQNTCRQLPPVSPDKLFDRFYRADEARTQRSGGYGIGLSVAQSIVESYGGTISAEYEKDNISRRCVTGISRAT